MNNLRCPECGAFLKKFLPEERLEVGTAYCSRCEKDFDYRWEKYSLQDGYYYIISEKND